MIMRMLKSLTRLFFLFLSFSSYANSQKDAIETIKAIFPGLDKNSSIKTSGCKIQKDKWATAVLTKEPFQETLTFSKDCDLSCSYMVKMDQFFPVKLKIRNFKNYDAISSQVKFTIIFEDMPLLQLEMKDATINGAKPLSFAMNYGVYLDLMKKDPLSKHKGGTLHLKKHGDIVLNKKVPLKF